MLPAPSGAAANRRRRGGGGAQQQALLLQPATPQMTYLLQPAVYQPLLPEFPGVQYPVSWSLPPYIAPPQQLSVPLPTHPLQEEGEDEDERCFHRDRQTQQSDVEGVRSEEVEDEVGEGIVISVLPDLVREVVNETISDIVLSYIGHRWESHTTPKPHPPTVTRPITSPLSPLSCQHHHGNEDVIGRHRPPLLHLITNHKTETELCKAVADHLLEQITFQLLLTSDLDGGVSMATRTQSKHILTEMVFNEMLVKLITTDSAHSN